MESPRHVVGSKVACHLDRRQQRCVALEPGRPCVAFPDSFAMLRGSAAGVDRAGQRGGKGLKNLPAPRDDFDVMTATLAERLREAQSLVSQTGSAMRSVWRKAPTENSKAPLTTIERVSTSLTVITRTAAEMGMVLAKDPGDEGTVRSEEHTSELQSRFGISYAVFCLKKKKC